MPGEERLLSIYEQFDRCAEAFCKETKGIRLIPEICYKGEERAKNLKFRRAHVVYEGFTVDFEYTAHLFMGLVNSVLSCCVGFNDVLIPLPLVADYLDYDTADPLCVPNITDDVCVKQAFDCLQGVLKALFPRIVAVSRDKAEKTKLLKSFAQECGAIFNDRFYSEEEGKEAEFYGLDEDKTEFFVLRFTSAPFINYLRGDIKKAVAQLSKEKNKTGYEKRLLRLWAEGKKHTADLSAFSEINADYNSSGIPKNDVKELLACFAAWIVLTPAITVGYGLFFGAVYLIESRNSIYLMGPEYTAPYCILCGLVTAICASYFTRHWFYKRLFKKHYEKYIKMDTVLNGGGSDRFMKAFLKLVVAASLVVCVLLVRHNLNFLPGGFYDNTKFFSIKGDYHRYEEIEVVYYKADRQNDFGETLDIPSYVLRLKDGTEIDFHDFDDVEKCKTELLPLLKAKGVKIEKV